ncbi:hypothetical protein FRACYDRAFT_196285 [Fragilariopsis cylindrus CCMP1102]|uniref:Helicase-associated domain-containing protein n=1 Tax=Fragilariopsis cylindrus CCMP1102 TaxID=635003 RepID=A0A1E7ERS3_9STRA|nr:hypothetical protein FRACYDRAFT_196285 [Fragilariopsis cylindrus CCMP1102]|eukprot:OEU08651.1 hypothetical protein FRACYDRAFT_196285 [Fragilariopsis cylindrus CCMP1102]
MLKQLQDDGYDIQPISSHDEDNDDNDDNDDDDDDEDNNTSTNNNSANSKYVDFENENDANNESKESLAAQGGRKRNKYYTWERNYQNLRYYRIRYGHCNVPQRSPKNQKNDKLGKWVSNMRSAYTAQQKLTGKNITTKISKHQIDKLNSIGFHWKLLEPSEEELARTPSKQDKRNLVRWYERCNELGVYRMKHNGDCNVPRKDPRLGEWVNTQRKQKNRYEAGLKTAMTDEKLQHLSDMGFEWSVKKEREDAMWNQRYEELKKFKEEHCHCRVTLKSSRKLGKWMKNFESEFGLKTSMTSEKIEHLEDMSFQWSVKKECEDTTWNQRYEELLYFKEKHGHCRVPQRTSGKLGLWVRSMRSTARRPKCNEKMEKLKAVGLFDS